MNSFMSPNYIPKVSVIVPVYNTELYVERAIISLMEQTLDDVQFIIIDDGSKDNSLSIIKQVITRYPARQGQVTLISRENRGVAATRAQGMELATGDYVIHLDSDDWAELNWLELLYSKATSENADIVVCNYYEVHESKIVKVAMPPSNHGFECAKELLCDKLRGYTWNKLISRNVINYIDTPFVDGINYLEDFIYVMKCFSIATYVSYHEGYLYNYNQQNINSLTKGMSGVKNADIINTVNYVSDICDSMDNLYPLTKELISFKIKQKTFLIYGEWESVNKNTWQIFPETRFYTWFSNVPIHFKLFMILADFKLYFLASVIMRCSVKIKHLFLSFVRF